MRGCGSSARACTADPEQRDTAAANVNEYKESPQAYGSKVMLKGAPAKPGSPPRKPISSDFTAK